jgi:hypothetical protein
VLLTAACAAVLVIIGALIVPFAARIHTKDIRVVVTCGGNTTVAMTIQGKALLSTADLLRSDCSAQIAGSSVAIQCPALARSRGLDEQKDDADQASAEPRNWTNNHN